MKEKIRSIFSFSIFSDIAKELMSLRMIKSKEEINTLNEVKIIASQLSCI